MKWHYGSNNDLVVVIGKYYHNSQARALSPHSKANLFNIILSHECKIFNMCDKMYA